jgi:ABC-2 type transport system permease protein
MAVYKRSYRGYEGPLTPRWSRFLILSRYAARGIFSSRIVTGLFVICFFFPLVMIAGLYLNHNVRVLSLMKLHSDHLFDIDGSFFMMVMSVQSSMAFLMTAFFGPNMIAPDLANNALPVYFCRPLSRTEYVFGKACVILMLLSFITWIPGLTLFAVETTQSGLSWGWEHREFAAGILVGSFLWISFLALLALALSAWVRWKLIAGALLLGVMFFTSGFAAAFNAVLDTKNGSYLDPAALLAAIYGHFFGLSRIQQGISTAGAMASYAVICGFCVFLLSRKVRAFEVVR